MLRLASLATEVTFEENAIILETGQRSRYFYLIAEGSVAVELRTERFAVCVQALGADQVFGWSSLLDDQDTLFQVRARERVRALRLDGVRLSEACRMDTELGAELYRRTLRVVASRVKATEEKFAEMCGVKV
jgi:CRP/FNR family transcriptional regulator, cyclic AMP receptor protein